MKPDTDKLISRVSYPLSDSGCLDSLRLCYLLLGVDRIELPLADREEHCRETRF